MSLTDDTTTPRRVAIVTYYFPPLGGVGVQRVLKHATYLRRFGWQSVIFTPKNPAYEITDPDLANAVPPELEVRRSFIFEPSRVYRWLAAVTGSRGGSHLGSSGSGKAGGTATTGSATGRADTPIRRGDDRLIRLWAMFGRLVFFPDEQVAWVPSAVRSVRTAARTRRFDAVLSSSPPITAHLVAGLARRSDVPWVADFRDPWIGNGFAPELPWLHRQLTKRIERWIVRRADLSLFATPSLRAAYALRYPDLSKRFVTLTNGYDRRDVPAPSEVTRPTAGTFRMIYAGSLYGEHELEIFLEGLRRFVERRPEFRPILRVEFLGWLSRSNRDIAERVSRSDLAGIVSFSGFHPREEALRRVAAADAGLLILCDEPGKGLVLPVKLFEYLGLDRPVLAVVPKGDVEDVLRVLDWGVVVRPDADAIAQGIEQVLTMRPPGRSADPDGRFDRVELARQLAILLDGVSERVGSDRADTGPRDPNVRGPHHA